MKEYTTDNIINICLAGHTSSGKTMLAEAMLFNAKIINKMGGTKSGTTVSDYRDYEIDNQHSMSLSLLNYEWLDKKINLLDCPGQTEFQGELLSALKVSDVMALVFNSVSDIEVGSELAWDYSQNQFKIPKIIILNMIDHDQSNFNNLLKSLKSRFGRNIFPLMFPINEGENICDIGDVLRKEVLTFNTDGSGDFSENKPEGDMASNLDSLHNELIELIAESDDSLLEAFFEKGELSEDELRGGLHAAILGGNLVPVFCASGEKNIGVKRIMEIISKYSPCASDIEEVNCISSDKKAVVQGTSINDSLCSYVFKTVSEQHVGELSFFRVFSGEVKSGDDVHNSTRNQSEKMRQVYYVSGNQRKDASRLIAGDIGAALKLKNTHTGDTITHQSKPIMLTSIDYPSPCMHLSVTPNSRGDEEKLSIGLSIMHEEDPTFSYRVDPELKQTIVSGAGDTHLNMNLDRITSRFGVDISKEAPKIPYRETITAPSNAKYRHKKQSGGSGQFAEVWLKIQPSSRGKGVDFTQSLSGQNVDRGFVPSVEKGINIICEDGIIAGCRVVDLKIDFYDGKMHPVDSNDMAFQLAGKHAFVDAFKSARPKLLEPIYKVKVKAPEDCTGDIMGDISSRRGKVGGMDTEGNFQIISAEIPQVHLNDYATALKAMTSGRGMFAQEFSHYEDMPINEANKVISEYEASRQQS